MFEHERIPKYAYQDIPLNEEVYLVDEKWAAEYEEMYLSCFRGEEHHAVGYVTSIKVIKVHDETIEISWYADHFYRFHEVLISIPKGKIKHCIEVYELGDIPILFIDSDWMKMHFAKSFSIFGLVDAGGVRRALRESKLDRDRLIDLRGKIDQLAANYQDVSFISFADSILIKSNWTIVSVDNELSHNYHPESMIEIAQHFKKIFPETIGLDCYTILTQGYNEFYDDALLHMSESKNHISLNSIGLPFAQLQSIDTAARESIKDGIHGKSEIYLDGNLYYSLNSNYGFEIRKLPKVEYKQKMSSKPAYYFYSDLNTVLEGLA